MSTLLAVCDSLVLKALEQMGKWIVRTERSRYRGLEEYAKECGLGTRPWYLAHTLWQPDDTNVSKCLRDAWQVVPRLLANHGTCEVTPRQVTDVLDSYVHDLLITGTAHDLTELAKRFESQLGLPVYIRDRAPCYA